MKKVKLPPGIFTVEVVRPHIKLGTGNATTRVVMGGRSHTIQAGYNCCTKH